MTGQVVNLASDSSNQAPLGVITALGIVMAIAVPPALAAWLRRQRVGRHVADTVLAAAGPGARGRGEPARSRPRPAARRRRPAPARPAARSAGAADPAGGRHRAAAARRLPARLRRLPVRAVRRSGGPLPDDPVHQAAGELANQLAPIGPTAPGSPVAILDIPSIGIKDMVVVEGTSPENLTLGPGLLRAPDARPGGGREIFGRRATFGAPFARLDQLRKGDIIGTITGQGMSSYEVVAFGSSRRYASRTRPRTGCSW